MCFLFGVLGLKNEGPYVLRCVFWVSVWQSCVAAFLDVVIGGRAVETPPMSSMNLLEGLSRTAVYVTHNQLLSLVGCFTVTVYVPVMCFDKNKVLAG